MNASYAVVFAVSLAATAIMTPIVKRVAERAGALKPPSDRDVHSRAVVAFGGVAMIIGLIVALTVAALLPEFNEVFQSSSGPLGVVVAALVIFTTGFIDELRKVRGQGVSAPAKLAGMVLAG